MIVPYEKYLRNVVLYYDFIKCKKKNVFLFYSQLSIENKKYLYIFKIPMNKE